MKIELTCACGATFKAVGWGASEDARRWRNQHVNCAATHLAEVILKAKK